MVYYQNLFKLKHVFKGSCEKVETAFGKRTRF